MPRHIHHNMTPSGRRWLANTFNKGVKAAGKAVGNYARKRYGAARRQNQLDGMRKQRPKPNHRHASTQTKKSTARLITSLESNGQHNDLSIKNGGIHIVGHKKPIHTKGVFKYQEGKQGVFPGVIGKQNVFALPPLLTKDQMNGTTTASRSASYDRWEVDPFLLNPFSTIPTNGVYPGPMASVVAMDKLAILDCRQKLNLLNLENVAITVQVYWMVLKHDSGFDFPNLFAGDTAAEGLTQAIETFDNTLAVNSATGGAIALDKYGYNILSNSIMRKNYKILTKQSFILQAGDKKSIVNTFVWNKVVTKQMFTDRIVQYWANHTIVPVVCARGSLVGVQADSGAATQVTEVTYAPARVGFLTENNWRFGALQVNRLTTQRAYAPYLAGATLGGTAKLVTINDVDVETDVLNA